MNYGNGIGGILGTATVLPATAAIELVLLNHANSTIVTGLLCMSVVTFVTTMAQVSRYIVNKRAI